MKNNKYKITFHRTYEIEAKDKEEAIEEAFLLMSEEMVYFENNLKDFVSYSVEQIKNFNNEV